MGLNTAAQAAVGGQLHARGRPVAGRPAAEHHRLQRTQRPHDRRGSLRVRLRAVGRKSLRAIICESSELASAGAPSSPRWLSEPSTACKTALTRASHSIAAVQLFHPCDLARFARRSSSAPRHARLGGRATQQHALNINPLHPTRIQRAAPRHHAVCVLRPQTHPRHAVLAIRSTDPLRHAALAIRCCDAKILSALPFSPSGNPQILCITLSSTSAIRQSTGPLHHTVRALKSSTSTVYCVAAATCGAGSGAACRICSAAPRSGSRPRQVAICDCSELSRARSAGCGDRAVSSRVRCPSSSSRSHSMTYEGRRRLERRDR
eukprot:360685-Chlamydomonas_euryale.AAC.2